MRTFHARRHLRAAFLKAVADAWSNSAYVVPATFAAMAAAYSPWLNWQRQSMTLTDFGAFQVWWSMYFSPYALGAFDPHTLPPAPYDFNPVFLAPYTWTNPTDPITGPTWNVQINYNGDAFTRLFLVELYAAKNGVILPPGNTTGLYDAHLYAVSGGGTPSKISFNSNPSTWQIYPFPPITKPTTVAFRPNTGQTATFPGPIAHYGPPTDQLIYSIMVP